MYKYAKFPCLHIQLPVQQRTLSQRIVNICFSCSSFTNKKMQTKSDTWYLFSYWMAWNISRRIQYGTPLNKNAGLVHHGLHWENYISICFHIEWDMVVVTVLLSILNQMEFHLIQNRKENCHHDHIPFNLKGNEILVETPRGAVRRFPRSCFNSA